MLKNITKRTVLAVRKDKQKRVATINTRAQCHTKKKEWQHPVTHFICKGHPPYTVVFCRPYIIREVVEVGRIYCLITKLLRLR